jgi:hypothetical protein
MTDKNESDPDTVKSTEDTSRDAEAKLYEQLLQASDLLNHSETYGREGVIAALRAVVGFLLDRDPENVGHMLQPFTILNNAFKDLHREDSMGRRHVPELFTPNPLDDQGDPILNRSHSSQKNRIKVYAAACMGALVKSKIPKEQAASQIASAIESWPRVDGQTITASTVSSWRRELSEALPSDPQRIDFDELIEEFRAKETGAGFLAHVLKNGPPLLGGLS